MWKADFDVHEPLMSFVRDPDCGARQQWLVQIIAIFPRWSGALWLPSDVVTTMTPSLM